MMFISKLIPNDKVSCALACIYITRINQDASFLPLYVLRCNVKINIVCIKDSFNLHIVPLSNMNMNTLCSTVRLLPDINLLEKKKILN